MKQDKYQRRFYRHWVKPKDLYRVAIAVRETDLQVLTDKPIDKRRLREKICLYRRHIESYVSKDNRFLSSLKPISVELNAPPIIKEMAQAAKKANVGPMAAVAGAISECLGRLLLSEGYQDVIIENGGDIFLKTTKVRNIGIYAGPAKLWKNISLRIQPDNTPLGICCSSGTVGHSLSFGCAEAVVILSKNAALSDAVATATGNLIKSRCDLKRALDFSRSIKGVVGVTLILKNNLLTWGNLELNLSSPNGKQPPRALPVVPI